MRHAFHEAAIAHKRVGVVINDGVTIAIEFGSQQFFVDGHAHGIGDPLAEWTCGRFNPGGVAILRVTRCAAV